MKLVLYKTSNVIWVLSKISPIDLCGISIYLLVLGVINTMIHPPGLSTKWAIHAPRHLTAHQIKYIVHASMSLECREWLNILKHNTNLLGRVFGTVVVLLRHHLYSS